VASAAFAQIYRYLHLSDPTQKRQIKWLMYGSAMGLVAQGLNLAGRPDPLAERVALPVSGIGSLILPVAIGIAILRYHLWDIDLVINRTLVYVPLTAVIAGGYAASVALLQRLFVAATGQQSDAAIVLTT